MNKHANMNRTERGGEGGKGIELTQKGSSCCTMGVVVRKGSLRSGSCRGEGVLAQWDSQQGGGPRAMGVLSHCKVRHKEGVLTWWGHHHTVEVVTGRHRLGVVSLWGKRRCQKVKGENGQIDGEDGQKASTDTNGLCKEGRKKTF